MIDRAPDWSPESTPANRSHRAGPGSDHAAWLEAPGGERRYLATEILIGRGRSSDIQLPDQTVSRYHALIRALDGQYVLSDLGSSNGTFVNEVRLDSPRVLQPGDRIGFGRIALVFQQGGGGAHTTVVDPGRARVEHDTAHFHLVCTAGSFAAGQLPAIGDRLEAAYLISAEIAGADESTADPRPIRVALTDLPDPAPLAALMLPTGGFVVPASAEISEVYRTDSPGASLERALLLLRVARGPARALLSRPVLVDGLELYVLERLGGPAVSTHPALRAANARRDLPALGPLLSQTAEGGAALGPIAIGAFVGYLLQGAEDHTWHQFLATLSTATPERAVRTAYGRSLRRLEKAWRKSLQADAPGGAWQFVRLSVQYLRPYWAKITEIILYILVAVAFSIGMAKMQGLLLDKALIPRDRHALVVIMSTLIGALVLVLATSLRKSYITAWVSERVLRELRLRIFTRLQQLHPGFFQQMQSGDIISRMTSDLAAVEFGLATALTQGLQMILTLVAALMLIFLENWQLALIAVVGLPLFIVTGHYLGPRAARASKARQESLAGVASALQENLAVQLVVKAFSLQDRVIANFVSQLDTLFRASLRQVFLTGIFGISASSIASAIQITVLGIGAWLVIGGNLTAGTLFTFLGLMGQIIAPVQSLSGIVQALQQASGGMDRVVELLTIQPAITDGPGTVPLDRLASAIRFEDVTFGYTDDRLILQQLNLLIPAGATVALVGPSGCGKSTVLNLIARFYEPQAGRVTFDGTDVRAATLESLRSQLGVVFQETILFNTSIRENIRLGRPAATDADVEAAARAAELHELVLQLPEGYDTLVGERGSRLSGGQRQRVAIARAILRDPAILLLDEATSALDPRTESAINETLARLAHGRTVISVTHRLASAVHADQIYVFDQGQLLEQGRHEELVTRQGLYAWLWQEQNGLLMEATPASVVDMAALHDLPLFAHLDAALLETLARCFVVEHHPAGAAVVTEGQVGDRFYVIQRGQVDVLVADPAGRPRHLATLRAGDYFGEVALLYEVPRTATIRTRTPVELASLRKEHFTALLAAAPDVRKVLDQQLRGRQCQGVTGGR